MDENRLGGKTIFLPSDRELLVDGYESEYTTKRLKQLRNKELNEIGQIVNKKWKNKK